MNEKLKKALKIAGIIGLSALLFACGCGLGYCSTQKTGEPTKVLTERSRKNAVITTENGGYNGYEFTIENQRSQIPENTEGYKYRIYNVNRSNYTLTLASESALITDHLTSQPQIAGAINTAYSASLPENETETNLLIMEGKNYVWGGNSLYNWLYFTFSQKQNQPQVQATTFVLKATSGYAIKLTSNYFAWQGTSTNPLLMSFIKTDYFLVADVPSANYSFQDIISYYKERGYNDGYEDGEVNGYGDGFEAGSGTGKMFTALGVNSMRWYKTNLTATDQTDTTVTYRLLTFKDGENQTWSIYATNYIASLETNNLKIELFQGSTASSANRRLTLGNGTETSLGSGIWDVEPKDYATFTFAQIIEVYNNSLVENYFLLEGIPGNATGYDMGYQKGWNDGYNASPGGQSLDNVFSIFTKAFEATASFFNIKVFGFLPLYWFFLIPIFVAIVTLLMRMIKH